LRFFRRRPDSSQIKTNRHDVVLYTRRECHLCETAKETLLRHNLQPIEIDIDTDPQLLERFDHCVPVVAIDGKIRFRGRVDPRLLKRIVG